MYMAWPKLTMPPKPRAKFKPKAAKPKAKMRPTKVRAYMSCVYQAYMGTATKAAMSSDANA
jgi:hypothetical protein